MPKPNSIPPSNIRGHAAVAEQVKVKELYFYPIKSFRGLQVDELTLDKDGALFDREWMLVDENLRFLTQRQIPELAKISLQFFAESSIELHTENMGSVDFGLEEREGTALNVTVWRTEVAAFEVSRDVSAWLSELVGRPNLKLVRLSSRAAREFNPVKYPGRHIRFADQQPLLIIGHESLRDLEARAGMTMSMIRFRPNIVVAGAAPYAEDGWDGFRIGDLEFNALKPCSRCKITTVHPLTGKLMDEPLKTLATYRRQAKGIMFGYYYAHMSEGTIKLGAPVYPR